jgi:pimeloyl-ACP methyl ester carboxylesterase
MEKLYEPSLRATIDASAVAPPSSFLTLSEGWRALLEGSALLPNLPFLRGLPRGDGHPVYLLPGLMGDNRSMSMLQIWLTDLGYKVIPWKFGRNLGPRGFWMESLIGTVDEAARQHGQPVSLVGQSLGGIFAREIAKSIPEQVRQVITLGSPFRQATTSGIAPVVIRLFEMMTGEKAEKMHRDVEHISLPAPVPSTALFSRTDGIAHWKICIEEETPHTDNVEVVGSHCGMGFNPAAYYVIGDRLAQPVDKWRKFERSGLRRFMYPDAVYAAPAAP